MTCPDLAVTLPVLDERIVSALAAALFADLELFVLRKTLAAVEAFFFVVMSPILGCPIHAHYRRMYQRYLIEVSGPST